MRFSNDAATSFQFEPVITGAWGARNGLQTAESTLPVGLVGPAGFQLVSGGKLAAPTDSNSSSRIFNVTGRNVEAAQSNSVNCCEKWTVFPATARPFALT